MKQDFSANLLSADKVRFSVMHFERISDKKLEIYLENLSMQIPSQYPIEKITYKLFKTSMFQWILAHSELFDLIRLNLNNYWSNKRKNDLNNNSSMSKFLDSIPFKDVEEIVWYIDGQRWQPYYSKNDLMKIMESQGVTNKYKWLVELRLILYEKTLKLLNELINAMGAQLIVVSVPRTNEYYELE